MAQSQMPQMPAEMQQPQQVQQDMSVILVTAGCKFRTLRKPSSTRNTDPDCFSSFRFFAIADDHTIRFWEAWSGICGRTINQQPHWVSRTTGSLPLWTLT
jgi:hypothetical protein